MNYTVEADSFINDLSKVAQVRSEVADCLEKIAQTLEKAETEGKKIWQTWLRDTTRRYQWG